MRFIHYFGQFPADSSRLFFKQDLEPLVKFGSRYRIFRVYITVFITTGLISTGVITTGVVFRHSVVQTVLDARAGFDSTLVKVR
jgi:hypothetical protein